MESSQRHPHGSLLPRALLCAILSVLFFAPGSGQQTPPGESVLEDHVEVALREVTIRVVTRRGEPVTDLRLEEISIREGGRRQKPSFLRRVAAPPPEAPGAPPEALRGLEEARAEAERKILFVFDVAHSSLRARRLWEEGVRDWFRDGARPGDTVGLLELRDGPFWLVRPSRERADWIAGLEAAEWERWPSQELSQQISRLVDDIESCKDAGEEIALRCAQDIARSYVRAWDTEARRTLQGLLQFVELLGDVPGQKMLVLFSEGFVADPASLAAGTLVSEFGDGVSYSMLMGDLRTTATAEVSKLHDTALDSGVSFFTFDTRDGAGRGFADQFDRTQARRTDRQGFDPWRDAWSVTRGDLQTLARETGGVDYHGSGELAQKLDEATRQHDALYLVGYHRDDPSAALRKVTVKVARRGLRVIQIPR